MRGAARLVRVDVGGAWTVSPGSAEWSAESGAARGFVAFDCAGERVGWLRRGFAGELRRWPQCFDVGNDGVRLRRELDTPERRTAALDGCTRALARAGLVTGWRNERYAIGSTQRPTVLFDIERAAMHRFGLLAHGANLNGYVGEAASLHLWIARRSERKPIDPGLLDTLVGGGIGVGYTAWETLIKESAEEAGLPRDLVLQARSATPVRNVREVPDGLHRELVCVYDLALPASFEPVNRDGEVAGFHLASVQTVRAWLDGGRFSTEPGLVTRDFLRRHGFSA